MAYNCGFIVGTVGGAQLGQPKTIMSSVKLAKSRHCFSFSSSWHSSASGHSSTHVSFPMM